MDHDQTSVQSTIRRELLDFTLKRGALFSTSGALLIVLGGTLIPLTLLKIWGIPLFGLGLVLISVGLIPYRQLSRLQMKPHTIYDDGEHVLFVKSGKPLLKIAKSSIETVSYLEDERLYGIGIWLKRPVKEEERVKVLQPRFDFAAFVTQSMQDFEGCDLFLPYFTDKAFERVKGLLETGPKDLLGPDRAS